jgi:hypothetical protein
LKENGCPWGKGALQHAVQEGNLENIKWLRENLKK